MEVNAGRRRAVRGPCLNLEVELHWPAAAPRFTGWRRNDQSAKPAQIHDLRNFCFSFFGHLSQPQAMISPITYALLMYISGRSSFLRDKPSSNYFDLPLIVDNNLNSSNMRFGPAGVHPAKAYIATLHWHNCAENSLAKSKHAICFLLPNHVGDLDHTCILDKSQWEHLPFSPVYVERQAPAETRTAIWYGTSSLRTLNLPQRTIPAPKLCPNGAAHNTGGGTTSPW